jgi:hypothetical protein
MQDNDQRCRKDILYSFGAGYTFGAHCIQETKGQSVVKIFGPTILVNFCVLVHLLNIEAHLELFLRNTR